MKKQMSAFLLILFTLGLCSLFCFAEGEPSTASKPDFSDVPPTAWYAEAVAYCQEQGWMTGTSRDTFSPEETMTRAMLTAALYRRAGSPAVTGQDRFADTGEGAWYSDAILWAEEHDIVSGYDNGLFGVQDPVTREQLVTILWRLSGRPAGEQASPFADQSGIAPYALPAVVWARAQNIMAGKENNRFDPQGNATRGEVALILMNHDRALSRPSGGENDPMESTAVPPADAPTEEQAGLFYITANGHTLTADFAHNASADAFRALLAQGDLTVETHDYGNFEKVGELGVTLPTNDAAITTAPGDVILYQGSSITLYYDRNSWNFTRLGTVRDATREGLLAVLGTGSVTLTFSLTAPTPAERRSLVAYFSATNTTRPLAEYAADILGADLYEILPAVPYTADDLKYYTGGRADREQNDPDARPAIRGTVDNMDDYDVIFIGYPIWHGQAPRIISTFLEGYDMSGKTIVPFCTSHSSGIGSSDTGLHSLADGANWLPGKRFSSGTSRSDMERWINGLALPEPAPQPAAPVFDLSTGTVTLNNGYTMPINGLGTYSLHGETCINAVKTALAQGVRLIDTAHIYGNEAEIGRAIRESMAELGISREEIFVITKLYPGSDMADPEAAIQACLDRLDIGYVDMMLLHHPDPNDVRAYKAMEEFVKAGRLRSIGLSNWYVEELEEFLPQVSITPALIQNEIHPYYQENDVIPYIQSLGIVVQGWYPLGGRGHTAELLGDGTISAIARAHGVSSAQVILRWNLQKGVVVIPGSSDPDHIKENTQLYHFELTGEEMAQINALDRGEKHDWY